MANRRSPKAAAPASRGGKSGRKLKVFRTAIGFHDAYVAAPSQKAALEAWGSDANLFARGAAEVVDDPELTKAPLARPGEVIKVLRGSEAEQIRALAKGPAKGRRRGGGAADDKPSPRSSPERGRKGKTRGRRPSRAGLDKAERALAALEERHRAAVGRIVAQARALDEKRRALEARHREAKARLEERLADQRQAHARAIAEWAEG